MDTSDYNILQATLEQINASYKSLSRMYHPDKHNDPSKKQDAEMIFNRIKKAHSVSRSWVTRRSGRLDPGGGFWASRVMD